MQPLATAEQMQRFDRTTISKYGIPGIVLMENAGRAVVDELAKRVGLLEGRRVTVVCGKGNNGGDGFVIARHLLNRKCIVAVALLCKKREVKGDAKWNLGVLYRFLPEWKKYLRIIEVSSASQLRRFEDCDVVVDAIFGTGFKGMTHGIQASAIRWINESRCFVSAVDIASGVDASTGVVEMDAVKAELTVTMGVGKIGQYVGTGRDHSGEVVVADISIPGISIVRERLQTFRVESRDIQCVLPRRSRTAHKYSVGKVFVLGGSRKFTGAPYMCAQAAMRTGAGAVVLGAPTSVQPVLGRKLTEVMLAPLEETSDGSVSILALEAILDRVTWADAVAIGPGLSRDPETMKLVRELIASVNKPMVIDADALFALSANPEMLRKRNEGTILTPHVGELSEMVKEVPSAIEAHRVEVARGSSKKFRSIVCLKGSPTVTALPDGVAYLNPTGNPGMATIGSGDVLTGVIASLLAQGMSPEEAGYSGVFIHGLSGDIAASRYGQRSLMALDIMECIPLALKTLEQ